MSKNSELSIDSINEKIEEYLNSTKKDTLKLYWVTDNCDESWFIISYDDLLAQDFHVNYEGFDTIIYSHFYELLEMKSCIDMGEEYTEDSREEDDCIHYADATEVMELPKDFLSSDDSLLDYNTIARHAQIEDLEKLGFKIVDDGKISSQRIVKFKDELYQEGEMEMIININKTYRFDHLN